MRAVNLLPSDLRRAGAGGGSGSGAGAYTVLGVLAVAVLIVGLWAVIARQVKDREAEVASLNAEAQAAETQAGSLAGYEATVKVAKTRRTAVVDLIEKRFDWSDAFEEISRTVPANVWLTTMSGTVSPGVTVESGSATPKRAAHNGPAVELTGCTTSQDQVAVLMSRLRAMKGVSNVVLSASEKADKSTGGAGGKATTDCTAGSDQRPKFNLAIFYGQSAAPADPAAAAAAGQTAGAPAPAASGGTQ